MYYVITIVFFKMAALIHYRRYEILFLYFSVVYSARITAGSSTNPMIRKLTKRFPASDGTLRIRP